MNKNETDEIDLLDVIINFWNNKIKIAAITVIFIAVSIALFFANSPSLKTKTEIIPINTFENSLYAQYNLLIRSLGEHSLKSLDDNSYKRQLIRKSNQEITSQNSRNNMSQYILNEINIDYLLSLFLIEVQNKDTIVEALKRYQLIDQKKFDSEDGYLKAVENKAKKLVLLKPVVNDKKKNDSRLNYWTIEFDVYDKGKWEKVLSFIESEANKNVKNYLKLDFDTNLDSLKLLDQFSLEDLNSKINNAKKDYETETFNRLAFLKEQALIARKLNIENNTFEVEDFATQSYYMRGYGMIEKEIELIETRTNKDAFIRNLWPLKRKRRDFLEDKTLERIEKLFNSTPIVTDNNFKVAEIGYKDTKYESSSSLIISILYAGIFGIIFGMIFVLISNAIQQRK
tara:strand:- start:344 stop:1540 length:1197 start_codon:yes stop_codon:yes gene_type:complete